MGQTSSESERDQTSREGGGDETRRDSDQGLDHRNDARHVHQRIGRAARWRPGETGIRVPGFTGGSVGNIKQPPAAVAPSVGPVNVT